MIDKIVFYLKHNENLSQDDVKKLSLKMKEYINQIKNQLSEDRYVLRYVFTDLDLEELDEKFLHQENVFIDGFFGNEDLDFVHMSQEFSTHFVVINPNEDTRDEMIKFHIDNYHTLISE